MDYTSEDFTKLGVIYDVIFDTIGKANFKECLRFIKADGFYINANPKFNHRIRGRWVTKTSNKTVITALVRENVKDLMFLKEMIEAKKLKTVIDRKYSLEKIPDAHRYVEKRTKIGNVVINIGHKDKK